MDGSERAGLFAGLFDRGAAATGDDAWLQAMLDAEAALARALEQAGQAAPGAGAAVTAVARASLFDVTLLAQSEVAEVSEGDPPGDDPAGSADDSAAARADDSAGGSSAMPHKRNPVVAVVTLGCTRRAPGPGGRGEPPGGGVGPDAGRRAAGHAAVRRARGCRWHYARPGQPGPGPGRLPGRGQAFSTARRSARPG